MAPIAFPNRIPPFDAQQLTGIAKVLADTETGLTGSEIDYLLQDCGIPNVSPGTTKWKRLFNAFVEFQNEHQVGNHVIVFITRAMDPVTYTDKPGVFQFRQDKLNTKLAFCGMEIGDDGKMRNCQKVSNLDQARTRAKRLQSTLSQRDVHQDVLKYCKAEILVENYFHAVFEAMKSITAKIRSLSALTSDGAQLVEQAFGLGKSKTPMVVINAWDTKTLRGEQHGFVSLLKGLYGMIRNPLAHNAKIEWNMAEQDALDVLTMISLIHRKLDKACRYHGPP